MENGNIRTLRLKIKIAFVLALLSGAITGCMVGPNFHSPDSPKIKRYTETPLPSKTVGIKDTGKAGVAQTFVLGQDIPSAWWTLFHSQALNALIRQGIANSPNLAAAYATLHQAQETLNVQIGNSLFPAFNAQYAGQRQRISGASLGEGAIPPSIFNLYNANVNVSYTLDIFGGARRGVEALRAQVDFQQFEFIAAYLTLTSNIVTTAVNIASLQAQIEATLALIHAQEEQLLIIQKQFRVGGVSEENVLSQATLVAQTRANLPPLEKSLSQSYHALAVLIGDFPSTRLPFITLDDLFLPPQLPVSLPSNLVRQRPDVRASEALLHAASAQIGVATANLLPQFPITGTYGWQASIPSQLFDPASLVWSISGQITQPLFHGGALLASRRASLAAYKEAAFQYRQTVLQAFQNVADALKAIELDARTLRAQKAAEIAAKRTLILTQKQYRLGGVSYLALLNAQEQYEETLISRIEAQAARYSDTTALFVALGGGWWNKPGSVKEVYRNAV